MGRKLTVLEFYSGIGGMHYSLQKAMLDPVLSHFAYQVSCAFDINPVANSVYRHNFPSTRLMERSIEYISLEELETLSADFYLMSPPCQPYTRIGLQRGSEDPRAESFLLLLRMIAQLCKKPEFLLVENVKGFELSDTCKLTLDILTQCGYKIQQFLLSPTSFSIPNSRLRYFLLAKLQPSPSLVSNSTLPIFDSLPTNHPNIEPPHSLQMYLEDENEPHSNLDTFFVPDKVLLKYGRLFDVVSSKSNHSCCFTKSYFQFVEGTGSVLQTSNTSKLVKLSDALTEFSQNQNSLPQQEGSLVTENSITLDDLKSMKLRYFTPFEIASLHGFPKDQFHFPPGLTTKQRYRCLGNSLNVDVVSKLIIHLLSSL